MGCLVAWARLPPFKTTSKLNRKSRIHILQRPDIPTSLARQCEEERQGSGGLHAVVPGEHVHLRLRQLRLLGRSLRRQAVDLSVHNKQTKEKIII